MIIKMKPIKEALECVDVLYVNAVNFSIDLKPMRDKIKQTLIQAEKDLEILEILKKKLKVKSYDLGIEDIFICEEDEEDYKKIKEWL